MKTNLLIWLVMLLASAAQADDYSFDLGNGEGQFNVLDGQPYLLLTRDGPPGNAVDYREDKFLLHLASEKKLAFPLDGDKPELLLGAGKGRGTAWTFSKIKSHAYKIQVSEGKFKNWYLDIGNDIITVMYNGKNLRVRQFVLVENPGLPRAYEKYVVSK